MIFIPISLAFLFTLTKSQTAISCGDSLTGTWDGTTNGALTFDLELSQSVTVTWDARGSSPNTNPIVGTLVQYTYSGTPHGTADNDDVAAYPDKQEGVDLVIELDLPAGSYSLVYEGTEGHDTYSYSSSIACSEFTEDPTPSPTMPTPEPTPNPTKTPSPTTPAPTTPAPTTPAPTTPAPTTPAPTTPNPTTPSPTDAAETPSPTTPSPITENVANTPEPTKKPTRKPTPKPVSSGSGSDSEDSDDGFIFEEQTDSSNVSGGGGTVGIVLGGLVVLFVVGAVVFYVVRRRRKEAEVYFEERDGAVSNLDDDTAGINTNTDDHVDGAETEIVVEVEVHE